ncbi:neuroblast differentiation-associated protein AHNAK-like isoform X1 [Labeo rohita]|uniref:neuroblast differentiation-associated protein AHNAK-like isoform X1 n=1 Tax=Labeo rohita TaxID=84645 RepID=UPI0021E280B8|nr:neuroblast differentiation-associated protein AHNAK-like isoform X1 [Labeo rohita]
MCDCFHLAFPNWHASAAGEGRRLKGPEQDTDDDLVCEEPEVLEEERPRPQGSSPVEEFPTTEKYEKKAEGDFYDSPAKGSKKSKKIGFGSLFDKRSAAKMNQTEDMQSDQSEVIVKTVKEVCAEGLVVSGGKDGIFIKEVKPESPASKHLSVKEGDQLLSATVYFDNVSYEDALQILERAQPYKVAFCLKRKPPRIQEDAETMRPDITIGEEAEQEEEGRGPEMRGRRKIKKQHDRISWPKFPTFSKGRRANFKRSHSTSEAEEQRTLEISPPTSDTESPLKSPLKSPDGKDKKKMHKMKLKKRMPGRRSKSVEETQENEQALAADTMEVMDNQIIMNITEEQVPVLNLIESPKILNEAENTDSAKTRNEYTFPTFPEAESLHKAELISVDTTLKTSDITVTLGDDGKERREISEIKVSIPGKDKYEIEIDSQLKSSTSVMRTLDPSTFDNILDSPNVMSQTEPAGLQVDSDSKPINKEMLEKTQELGKTDMAVPKVDISLDMPEVGPISKSPKIGSDREKKERNILETESYGIRTRGPLADIATSKSHFSNTVNKLDFTSDTFIFETQTREDVSSADKKKPITPTPVISQPKSHALDVDRTKKSAGASTDIESKFKLPKVDVSEFDHQESITVKQKDPTKVPLLKREEIEIPGMEDKEPKAKVKSPRIKEQKVEKVINISKAESKHGGKAEEFNVEDVKEAVSKFPAFKLPERDITGVLVQREVTIMEMKSDKTGTTPKGSPCKISSMSTEINITFPDTIDKEKQRLSPVATKDQAFVLPKIEQVHLDETVITERKTDHQSKTGKMLTRDDKISASPDVKFKLPKREDIEIPGMEAIEQSIKPQKIGTAKDTDTQDEAVKDYTGTDTKADKNVHEKKSKKSKVSLPSFGIMTPDIRFTGIAIELPIKTTSSKSDSGAIKEMKTEAKISLDEDHIKKSPAEATFEKSQKVHDIEGDQMLHHDVKETSKQDAEGELKADIKSKDTDSSPQKKKLPKLKMPKIGGKMKGTAEVTTKEDATVQENDIMEVALDSEKRTSETDPKAYSAETDKNWSKLKMPSIDVSVPKIKIPKAEGKSKQEETGLSKPEAAEGVEDAREESGFRPMKFGISVSKEKKEEGGLLPDESEKSTIKVGGKTEVEPSELSQDEIKEAESKMKKRKISFPKFGFSKSDTKVSATVQEIKVSDVDITLQATKHEADGTELDVESKTTDVEAELKDSTHSPTKFKLPTIKLPKFGVSFPKTTDAGADMQVHDVSTDETTMDVKLPEAKLSVEATALSDMKGPEMTFSVSKPEADLSLPEGKAEIKGFQKKEIKSSEEISFSKPDIDANLTDHDAAFSKQDIKAAEVDVSLPQVDVSIPEGSMEIRAPDVNLTISKDEEEHKDITHGGTPVKFKLPSISLPKFGGKSSKIPKDMPVIDIDTEEPDVNLPETKITLRLKDEVPSVDVKDSFETTEGQFVSVDMKAEEAKLKGQEVTVTLPKFGISLPKVEAHKAVDSKDKESTTDTKESNAESEQAEKDPRSPTKMKLPTIKFPKFGVSIPKSADAVSDNQMPEVTKGEHTMEIKAPGTEITLETEDVLTSVEGPDVKISLSSQELKKPSISVDQPKVEGGISLPEAKLGELSAKAELTQGKQESKIDQEVDTGMKMKKTGFSLPKFGLSKPDIKAPEIDVSLAQVDTSKPEIVQAEKDPRSPTKMKLPTIKFPKFGVSVPKSTDGDNQMPDVTKDEPTMEIKVPETELSAELPSLPEMKSPHIILSVSKPDVDISTPEAIDAHSEKKKEKVLSPEISKPEIKMSLEGHGLDQDTALEDLKVQAKKLEAEMKLPSGSVDEVVLEAKQKESEFKLKKRKISFPKFGFSKSDTKVPDADTSLQKEGISVPDTEIKETEVTIPAPELEVQLKEKSTSGSPSKFKLPTISLPKFDISISKTGEESITKAEDDAQSEIKAASSQDKDTGAQNTEPSKSTFETQLVDVEIKTKDTDPGSQGSRFMMSKFDFSFPKIKGPEFKKGASRTDAEKPEVSLKHDKESAEGTASIPGASVDMEVTMKTPKMPSSGHEVSKQDIKAPKIKLEKGDTSMAVGEVDVNLESDLKIQTTEMLKDDSTMGGSPSKFKLPTFKLPKFGSSSSKGKAEITDLRGEEIILETEDVIVTSVEGPDVKISVSSQELKKPSISVDQPKVEGSISLPEAKLGELSAKAEVSQAKLDSKIDQEVDLKDTSIKMKKTGFSLPKFGFSKPDIKAPEIDVSLPHVDTSKPEGDVKIKEHGMTITVVEDDQKDPTKFKLPSISIPKIGGQATKEEITMPRVDIAVKGPEVSGLDAQIKISGEAPTVDIKGPHLATEGQSVSVDLNVEDAELGGQGGKFKMPRFGIGLPKVKGFDLSTSKSEDITEVQQIDIKKPEITTEGMVHPPEPDSKGLDVQMKTSAEFGFTKPELKAPEVDVSIQRMDIPIPEGSLDIEGANVDIKVSKTESDQKGSTIFGSPTKFKLPTISLPKFGVKSQKAALDINVTDSELEGTNIKTDISKPDVKLEMQPPSTEAKVEGSVDVPEVDSKGVQIKVKRPSFSFPKFGFSKLETATPEVNVSVPKAEVSIPEVDVPVKVQKAEVTLPGGKVEQKDLTIVTSPTKFKLPEVNLPKFGVKTSKGTVSLPSADKDIKGIEITAHEPDIKVSGQTPKIDLDVKEIETDIHATIKETDVHLPEGKVILPQTDVDVHGISIEGKADMPEIDLKGHHVKLKKPGFSLPKFGFSKPDIKGQDVDASQPKVSGQIPKIDFDAKEIETDIDVTIKETDVHLPEGKVILPQPDVDVQGISIEGKADMPEVDLKGHEVKLKMPSFSLPKFGFSKPDIKGQDVDASQPKVSGQIPKIDFDAKEIETDIHATIKETDVHLPEGKVILPQPDVDVQGLSIEGKADMPEVELKGHEVKLKMPSFSLPKFGFSKPDIKGQDVDASQPKVSGQIPKIDLDAKEIETDIHATIKETDVHLPEGKVILPQPDVDVQGLSIKGKADMPEVELKGHDVKLKKPGFSLPKFGFSKPDFKGQDVDASQPKVSGQIPKIDLDAKEIETDIHATIKETGVHLPEGKVILPQPDVDVQGLSIEGKADMPEVELKGHEVKLKMPSFSLPKFGFSKPDIKGQDVDASQPKVSGQIPKIDLDAKEIETDIHATIKETDVHLPEGKVILPQPDVDVQGLSIEGKADMPEVELKGHEVKLKMPSFSLPKFGFSKPDIKGQDVDASQPKVSGQIPKIDLDAKEIETDIHATIKETDVHLPEGKVILPQPDVDVQGLSIKGKADMPEVELKGHDVKLKKPGFSLPKFGFSKPDFKGQDVDASQPKVSGQIPKIDLDAKEIETDIHATIKETDVHLPEGKVILPQPDVNIQDISIKGKADMPEVDLKGHDVKLKKPTFSLPKFGFSKPDIKGQDVDASQPKIDMSMQEGNIPVKVEGAEITIKDEVSKHGDTTKFKMPSINLPKFGFKYPKATADIPAAEVDIKEPEIPLPEKAEVQTTVTKTNIDIKGPSVDVDIKVKEIDIDGTGSKFKLPNFGIGMPKVKGTEMEGKEINIETDLLCEEKVNVQQPSVEIQNVTIEGKTDKVEVDSKGLKVKLPTLGFSKPDLKAPKVDVSLPKADLGISVGNVDVSGQSADIKLPEQEPDLKEDTFGSPTRFKLPTISLPKFGTKASKDTVDIPTAHVDIKVPEISLPDKTLSISGEVSSVEMKGPTVEDPSPEINIKGGDKEQQEGKFKVPKFGIALPTIKGPDSDQGLKKALPETEVKMSGGVPSIDKKELKLPKGSVDVEVKEPELEVEKSKIKLPQFGISLQGSKSPEIDISVSKAEVPQTEVKEAGKDVVVEEPADVTDMSSKGLKMKKPSFGFPKLGFSRSDGKAQDIQGSEMAADISLPEGTIEIGETEKEGKTEITSPQFGSPTKFKLPTIKLPKFGVSTPKVSSDAAKADSETKDIKVSSVDYEIETSKVDPSGDIKGKTAEIETPSIDINIKEKELHQEGQEIKFKLPKFGISLPKVKGPEVTVTTKEIKTETHEIGITGPEMKVTAEDVSLPKVDLALERSSTLEKKEVETESKDDTALSGSPSKFKLPTFKMPKFGTSAQKTSDAKVKVAEVDVPDTDLNIEDKPVQVSKELQREGEIKETTEQPPEAAAKKLDGDKGSPSKFKLPTIKMPKLSISRTKSQEGEEDTTTKANAPDAKLDPKDNTQGSGKSPKFTMPTLEDVLRGFEVEFNVPTIEEMEAQNDKPSVKQDQEAGAKAEEAAEHKDKGVQEKSKFKFKFPKLGFSQSSDESDKLVDAKIEESEKQLEASADQKATVSKEQAKTEKGGWFKFSFSSPTKTAKTDEKEIIQPPEEANKPDEEVEKESSKPHEEPEKSSLSEAVEENLSPTLSLKSSEAFADISSTVTTEQIALSQTSPTKVKVKYAEPTATVGVNDVQSDVVTSTARCELISMEPHQPEKVNIPFSSDMSSTSVDTLKQMSGEIHVITTNIQAIPETQQASILTNLDAHGIHISPLQVTLGSDSVLTVEETRVQSGMHTLVERHVVKETLHDDKETVLVTHRTRVFEGDSAEPISDETASSIRRLKDTVHIEKMRFFDNVPTTEEVTIMSSETSLRHMDSSTDDNDGK